MVSENQKGKAPFCRMDDSKKLLKKYGRLVKKKIISLLPLLFLPLYYTHLPRGSTPPCQFSSSTKREEVASVNQIKGVLFAEAAEGDRMNKFIP